MKMDILKEGFSEDLVCFVEYVGVDMFMDICDKFGGSQIYFPKKDSLYRSVRNEKIREMYDGSNAREIAKMFGITKNQVDNILKGK